LKTTGDSEWPMVEEHFRTNDKNWGRTSCASICNSANSWRAPIRRTRNRSTAWQALVRLAEEGTPLSRPDRPGLLPQEGCARLVRRAGPRKDRWDAQSPNSGRARWQRRVPRSPAIFCYDLMNEPVVPGGKTQGGRLAGAPLSPEKHFVQVITLDQEEPAPAPTSPPPNGSNT